MATIVEHKASNKRYILVGTSRGPWNAERTGLLYGQRTGKNDETAYLVALADNDGVIGWAPSDQVQVVSVDGKPPHLLLGDTAPFR